MPSFDEGWLARNAEQPLSPRLAVVDSHFHMWDFSNPAYFGDSYRRDAQAAGIVKSVFVECTMGYRASGPVEMRQVGEVEFAAEQARNWSLPQMAVASAIVGMVDMTLGGRIEPVLDEMNAAANGRFRGVRIRAAHDDDATVGYGANGVPPGFLLQSSTQSALKALQSAGYSLDVYTFHTQLADVLAVAKAFPNLPIVVNHIGAPIGAGQYAGRRSEVFEEWRRSVAELARCGNVLVKIGGFGIARINIISAEGRDMPPGSDEIAERIRPWINVCLEAYGASRCMFGSNFPVDKSAMGMTTLINAIRRATEGLSEAETSELMAGAAERFYRI
ncbi:MAG: amidohydrolase family protein [Rhizobiales bacterium]|nr:amidohydrolase family protein [Hyphomicrobiales bacterium]